MRKLLIRAAMMSFLLAAFAVASYAQGAWPPPEFSSGEMKGSWAVQVHGDVFLPAPFDTYNGPFVRTGRLLLTPDGKLKGVVTANYAGFIEHEAIQGVYSVSTEGLVSIQLINVPIPSLPPGVPNVFTFDGVLCEGGKKVKLMMSGVRVGPQEFPNIATSIFGELVRQ